MVRYRIPISDSEVQRLLNINGVISVSEGLVNGTRGVIVGVTDPSLRRDPRIPSTVEGFPVTVEVEQSPGLASISPPLAEGPPKNLPTPVDASTTKTFRPIPSGVSIGHEEVSAGTSSFVAWKNGEKVQVSNSHVLARWGHANIGDPILQPGSVDGGNLNEKVGTLAGDVPVENAPLVDVAWYKPDVGVDNTIRGIGVPDTKGDPELGDEVKWSGRTSGVASATVDRVNMNVKVGQSRKEFRDQFRLDAPLLPGDSGSPIVKEHDDGTIQIVGVGFAATQDNGYCNYISNVESAAGLAVVVGDDNPTTGGSADRSQLFWLAIFLVFAWAASQ